ncbi:MAG: AMP-binding protein, partial [Rhodomicrobiaceae bacterium]
MFDVGATLIAAAARDPRRLSLVDGDLRMNYSTLLDRALRVANGLGKIGVNHGDHLLIILQNRAEMAILHWATQLAGIIATPVNWRAKPEEVEFFLQNSESRAVVFEDISAAAVAGARAARSLP